MVRFSVSGEKRRISESLSPSCWYDDDEVVTEDDGGEARDADGPSSKKERAIDGVSVFIDPDTLDCPICYEALSAPVFQCQNGHVACSVCFAKMDKCYVCSCLLGPGSGRCLALEKVLESVRVSCPYAVDGCKELLSYAQRGAHEEKCSYAPCSCPSPGCKFEGHLQALSSHFISNHFSLLFRYDVPIQVSLGKSESLQMIRGPDGILYLLCNSSISNIGNSLSVVCIHPNIGSGEITYELTASSGRSSLSISASVLGLKKWKGVPSSKEFLLVPHSFFDSEGELNLKICVRKHSGFHQ